MARNVRNDFLDMQVPGTTNTSYASALHHLLKYSPVWVADLAFLPDDAHRIAVATGHHQLRIFDIKYHSSHDNDFVWCSLPAPSGRAQRRPVVDFELKELPNAFTCIVASSDPNVITVGDTLGNAVEIDLRNKKIKGSYRGEHRDRI